MVFLSIVFVMASLPKAELQQVIKPNEMSRNGRRNIVMLSKIVKKVRFTTIPARFDRSTLFYLISIGL